jgi:hypothetical protein
MNRDSNLSMIGSIVMKLCNKKTELANEQKQYLLDAFRKILNDESADIALGLKQQGQGGKSGDEWLMRYRHWMVVARIKEVLAEQEIDTPTEAVFCAVAKEPVCDIHDGKRQAYIDADTVKKIWYTATS